MSEQEPGGVVPPYDGRKTSAEPDQDSAYRDGVRVGGATGPVVDDDPKAPAPKDTDPDGPSSDDDGVDITAHIPGVPKGEDGGA